MSTCVCQHPFLLSLKWVVKKCWEAWWSPDFITSVTWFYQPLIHPLSTPYPPFNPLSILYPIFFHPLSISLIHPLFIPYPSFIHPFFTLYPPFIHPLSTLYYPPFIHPLSNILPPFTHPFSILYPSTLIQVVWLDMTRYDEVWRIILGRTLFWQFEMLANKQSKSCEGPVVASQALNNSQHLSTRFLTSWFLRIQSKKCNNRKQTFHDVC